MSCAHALTGWVHDHHRYALAQHLVHLDVLDAQIADLEQQLMRLIALEPPSGGPPAGEVGMLPSISGG